MAKEVRYLRQVEAHLVEQYGKKKAKQIMKAARQNYADLLEENKDEPEEYYMHTRERIYPAIATFDALLAAGVDRQEAADFCVDYYKWRSAGMASKIQALFKIPGLYKLAPKVFFSMTEKSFGPQAGFRSENQHLEKGAMQFDMVQCPYQDTCVKYGCPEIVRGFCDADDICYGDLHPKLVWGRTKTIGHGDGVCDFKISIRDE